jgi:signal transduction histidine kinase
LVSLQRTLLLLIVTALLAGIVPAGVVIDRRLAREVEARAHDDLAQAPRLLADRNMALAEAMLMHAKEVARAPGLADAMARGDRAVATRIAEAARGGFGDAAVVASAAGERWAGPSPGAALVAAARRGEMPVSVVSDDGALYSVTVAGVTRGGVWLGVAGVSMALDRPAAGILAALTRSDVLILGAGGALTAATTGDTVATVIARYATRAPRDGEVREVVHGAQRYLVVAAALGDVATMVFVRDLTRDLAVLPAFRRVVVLSGGGALLLALVLGTAAAHRLARPVGALADAADRLAAGDVGAPLMGSSIREIARLSDAFDAMRRALAARLAEVTGANRELADRQARLEAVQSELLQRERLAVSSRLVAELSHEIRNPIANLRNCLEIVRRRVDDDPQAREFADLAIDELLRMHELAEQLLDLNRPRDPAVRTCDVRAVVREVVVLVTAGLPTGVLALNVDAPAGPVPRAAIAPDALKQVLLNLVQNAREALTERAPAGPSDARPAPGRVTIAVRADAAKVMVDVADDGPGIPADVLPRIFDPFFTTKGAVHGVGLGLFVAEGLVRTAGGRLTATNRAAGGAQFHLELPAAAVDTAAAGPSLAPAAADGGSLPEVR